jgi:hypothetical protein
MMPRMVLIRFVGNVVPSIRDCIFGHVLKEHVCIEPPELVGPDSMGASEGFLGWIAYRASDAMSNILGAVFTNGALMCNASKTHPQVRHAAGCKCEPGMPMPVPHS